MLVKKTDYDTKIGEIKNKTPGIIGLVTIAAFNTKVIDHKS